MEKAKQEFTVAEIMEIIVRKLVDNPEQVEVREVKGDYTTVLEVKIAKEDHGKVIGKKGVNAQAIRTLMCAASGKDGRRYILEILD